MEQRIKQISEAFSMQPNYFTVSTFEDYERLKSQNNLRYKELCRKIELQIIQYSENERQSVYVGYNFAGKKLFQYLANSVNVQYFID